MKSNTSLPAVRQLRQALAPIAIGKEAENEIFFTSFLNKKILPDNSNFEQRDFSIEF